MECVTGIHTVRGPMTKIDLNGLVFDRLTVLKPATNIGRTTRWWCLCVCGQIRAISSNRLRTGETRSCGCLHKEELVQRSTKHGHSKRTSRSPEYESWAAMHARCVAKKGRNKIYYADRGIVVCERWAVFENFLEDMGARPPNMTLDRKDNDGNYEPSNCRWATQSEQRRNSRRPPPGLKRRRK